MANPARRQDYYATSGNVAYQRGFDGSAVRAPRPQEAARPAPRQRPRVQPRERVRERPHVEARQPGAVAPFAVIGFAVVALCAMLLVVSYAQLAIINDQTVQLKSELEELKTTEAVLLAQYELTYDLSAIEQQLTSNGSMVKLQPDQITYLDISVPDNMVIYTDGDSHTNGILQRITSILADLS